MLLIPCPWCGPRDEVEFRYGGQAGLVYPPDPSALSDEEWAAFLFMRDNPRGAFRERWMHAAGCRRWFELTRSTATHEIDPDSATPPGGTPALPASSQSTTPPTSGGAD